MADNRKRCIFCDQLKKMTREHIWGDWLKAFVQADMKRHDLHSVIVNRPGTENTSTTKLRSGDPLRSKVHVVCEDCNTRWMSVLQNDAKPHLIPLFEGKRIVLGKKAQAAVAAWAGMATMTAEFITRDPTTVAIPQSDRAWLREHRSAPSDWRIWIGRFQRDQIKMQWVHTSMSISMAEDAPSAEGADFPPANTQTTTFIIGQLLVHTMSTRFPNHARDWNWRTYPRAADVLTQISPRRQSVIVWAGESMLDRDAESISTAFFNWVASFGRRHG